MRQTIAPLPQSLVDASSAPPTLFDTLSAKLNPAPVTPDIDTAAKQAQLDDRKAEFRQNLAKRKAALRFRFKKESDSPTGEELSGLLHDFAHIDLELIVDDPKFVNTRVFEDVVRPELDKNDGQKMGDLEASMSREGLKVPILVVPSKRADLFHVRAGFRRLNVARKLKWKAIPAIILPYDTPDEIAYWANILENSTRKQLTTYEIANAARHMRDSFRISGAEFSRRTGYSEGYVSKLLTCIDRLPPLLIEHWKNGTGLDFERWYRLALMAPENAVRLFHKWHGTRPTDTLKRAEENRRISGKKLAPAKWINRMQRLYLGLEGSDLQPKTRDLALRVVEFCMGQTDSIPGVFSLKKTSPESSRRRNVRDELVLPDLPHPDDIDQDLPTKPFDLSPGERGSKSR